MTNHIDFFHWLTKQKDADGQPFMYYDQNGNLINNHKCKLHYNDVITKWNNFYKK